MIILANILCLLATAKVITGDAEVLVRFEYYMNSEGTLSNGHCCDGWPFKCETNGGCDYYFRVCLDEDGRPDNTKSCQYGYHRSNKVANDKTAIIFSELGDSFGGLPNPLTFKVPEPVDGRNIQLKIDVKEEDRWTKGDYVDYFSQPIEFYKGIFPTRNMILDLESRTRLRTAVIIKCSDGWYGEECTVRCEKPSKVQHYSCDLWTGEKICKPAWSGDNCSQRKPNRRRQP